MMQQVFAYRCNVCSNSNSNSINRYCRSSSRIRQTLQAGQLQLHSVILQMGMLRGMYISQLAGAVHRSLADALRHRFLWNVSHADFILEGLCKMEEEAADREWGSGEERESMVMPDMMQGMARVVSRSLKQDLLPDLPIFPLQARIVVAKAACKHQRPCWHLYCCCRAQP